MCLAITKACESLIVRWLFSLLVLIPCMSRSQAFIPKREVRAVWIATVAGLDWPTSLDVSEQQKSLREMVEKLCQAHFNTIFFQVRGRADAMYRSAYEPWAQQLTGTLGKDPGWDPLEFVIGEAHRRGMEVHAWFNTFLIKSGASKPPESTPRHVILEHPEWLHLVKGEWWLDPGIPPARKYTMNVALDIVRRYDVDGIHFDFIRYPGESFPDQISHEMYGAGMSRGDWRRENINKFVREFYDAAMLLKPMLKVGSAPIGIYNHDAKEVGLYSYDNLFQDSRRWLREGKHDYLVPQVYWSLGHKPSNPDFAAVVRDWSMNTYGRQMVIGVGAYKPDVYREVPLLVDTTRFYGVDGNAFFRYENIESILNVGMRYRYLANIPPMPWKDSIPPNPPSHFKVVNDSDGIFKLQWHSPARASDGDGARFYDVYRSTTKPVNLDDARNLVHIVVDGDTTFADTIRHPTSTKYFYTVTALDKGHNESSAPKEESIVVPEIVIVARKFSNKLKLAHAFPEPASDYVFFPYELKDAASVSLVIVNEMNNEAIRVVDTVQSAGRHIAAADVSGLAEGTYRCELITGGATLANSLTVKH